MNRAPPLAPPVKIPFLLLSSLLPPPPLPFPPILSLSPPLPEASLGVPLSTGSQDRPAVPPCPGGPTHCPQPPLAHAGASQARPPASLPQRLAAAPTPRPGQGGRPGSPGTPTGTTQPPRLQQRLGGLGGVPPAAQHRQEPRCPGQEVSPRHGVMLRWLLGGVWGADPRGHPRSVWAKLWGPSWGLGWVWDGDGVGNGDGDGDGWGRKWGWGWF